jgi:hypothetical protein
VPCTCSSFARHPRWNFGFQQAMCYFWSVKSHKLLSLGFVCVPPATIYAYTTLCSQGARANTYLLTYLLTYSLDGAGSSLKSWQLLSLSKTSLLSWWNPKVHYHIHKSPPPVSILSQPNLVRPIYPFLLKVHLNVILPPGAHPGSYPVGTRALSRR